MMKEYLLNFDLIYDKEEPELVISVGGDGTILEAFHRYVHRLESTAFVGVHTGHLGFYADWVPEEIEKLVIEIAKNTYKVVEYPLLEVIIRGEDEDKEKRFLALNEAMIKTADGSVVFDVSIRGEHFETFRGDGLCISTSLVITGYYIALGGAIITPSLDAIQLSEMDSINNSVVRTIGSPFILPKHHTCLLKPMVDRSFLIAI